MSIARLPVVNPPTGCLPNHPLRQSQTRCPVQHASVVGHTRRMQQFLPTPCNLIGVESLSKPGINAPTQRQQPRKKPTRGFYCICCSSRIILTSYNCVILSMCSISSLVEQTFRTLWSAKKPYHGNCYSGSSRYRTTLVPSSIRGTVFSSRCSSLPSTSRIPVSTM